MVNSSKTLDRTSYYLSKGQEIGLIGTWDLDLVENILTWTKQNYLIFGVPLGTEMNYEIFIECVHPDDRAYVNERWMAAVNGEVYDIEHRVIVDGKVKWVREKAEIEFDSKGVAIGAVGVAQDITYKIETQRELEDARKKAEESNQLKSAFLANVSHEIRTPLNGILGFTQLLIDDRNLADDDKEKYLEVIKSSGKSLLNIINDIIDISKIEANQLQVDSISFSLNQVFDETFQVIKNSYLSGDKEAINLIVEKELSDKNCHYIGDPLRFKQVLLNLLSNAVKFTNKGEISFGYSIISPDRLRVFVSDTGLGMATEDLPKIFKRFGQIKNTGAKNAGGSGLGLSICQSLIELMDGTLEVESEVDKGSTFYVELPYVKSEAKEDARSNDQFDIDLSTWKDKRMLIVEDNYINQLYFKELLKTTGLKIFFSDSGEGGVESFKNGEFDIVLMDLNLPGISGNEAIKQIREFDTITPIIVQSGYAMADDKQESLNAGASSFISKPINMTMLMGLINSYIG